MQINGDTFIVGIMGDPVAHSLSPRMQNAAIASSGLNAVYVPFHVTPAQLCDAIQGVRALGLRGVNLTVPHKETACRLVDELDSQARLIGAINTIVNTKGVLKGYNTDGTGLVKTLQEQVGGRLSGARVLIVGAGGAARAALVSLSQAGASWIGIANRTPARSGILLDELADKLKGTTFAQCELSEALTQSFGPVDILINASVVGLKGDSFGFDLLQCVHEDGFVYDMVYRDEPTPLVREALEAGLSAEDGRGMLASQGEVSFKLWFGACPRAGVMRQSLD